MEIHSTSRHTLIGSYPSKNLDTRDTAGYRENKKSIQNTSVLLLPPPKQVKDNFNLSDVQNITEYSEKRHTKAANASVEYAINAYLQENVQPLKIYRAEHISRIDIFA